MSMGVIIRLFTRGLVRRLSAAGFTGMPTTTLSLDYFYHIIAKYKIEFPMERHLD